MTSSVAEVAREKLGIWIAPFVPKIRASCEVCVVIAQDKFAICPEP